MKKLPCLYCPGFPCDFMIIENMTFGEAFENCDEFKEEEEEDQTKQD